METQTPSSSTPPQLSQSPKPASHHKLLKMLLIIVAFMLIAVIGTSAYVGYQANQQVVDIPIVELGLRPVSTPTIDETDGWVTYINKDLGISFQYPQNSRINPSYDTSIYSKNTFMELFNDEYDLHFSVSYVDNLNNLSLEELDSEIHKKEEEEGYGILSPNLFSTDFTEKTIGDNISVLYEPEYFCEPAVCERYVISKDKRVYQIIISSNGRAPDELPIQNQVLTKILSTFRFVEEGEISEQKTYVNEEYKFTFKYPSDWKIGVSTSNGYPSISLLDLRAQQVTLPKTELDQGAAVWISMNDAQRYAVKPVTLTTLKEMYLNQDVTTGGIYPNDPEATQTVEEEMIGSIGGIRRSIKSRYYESESFILIRNNIGSTLVFDFSLGLYDSPPQQDVANGYRTIFNQILSTFQFTE